MQVYAKGIEVEIIDVGGWSDPADYVKINPLRTTPTLIAEDQLIPDSTAISEYLEEVFIEPSLLPDRPIERARVRTISHLADKRVLLPALSLFQYIDATARDETAVDNTLQRIDNGLGLLCLFMTEKPGYATGDKLTIADCMSVPTLYTVTAITRLLGVTNPIESHPKLTGYWAAIAQDPAANRILSEMGDAFQRRFGTLE